MKILANDGISEKGINLLSKAGHEVITVNVSQDQLIKYINDITIIFDYINNRMDIYLIL